MCHYHCRALKTCDSWKAHDLCNSHTKTKALRCLFILKQPAHFAGDFKTLTTEIFMLTDFNSNYNQNGRAKAQSYNLILITNDDEISCYLE